MTAGLLHCLSRTELWGKNVFNWIVPLGTEPSKGFCASAAAYLSLSYSSTHTAAFSPVPGTQAAAWVRFVIAH